MTKTTVNGIQLYYETHGTGSPLVVINGLSADVSQFRTLTDALAKKHKVLAFDNRGIGRTGKPDEPYTIEQMATDTAGVMRNAGFTRAHILGISMGGRIAIELTLTHPDMVNKLILTSTSIRPTKPHGIGHFITFRIMPRLPILKGRYPQPFYAFERQRTVSRSYDATSRVHQIRKPTLIAHGIHDKIAPVSLAKEMHLDITGSKLTLFNGVFSYARDGAIWMR